MGDAVLLPGPVGRHTPRPMTHMTNVPTARAESARMVDVRPQALVGLLLAFLLLLL